MKFIFLVSGIFFVFTSCGIKGSPTPPEGSEKILLIMSPVE